ncbi:Ig-like domain-containing protein, partial [Flavobacterium sp.]
MRQKNLLVALAIAMVTLITSCAKDDFQETVGVCPTVTATNPMDGATSVPLNQIITATFNEAMNPNTIDLTSFTIVGATTVAGTISYLGTTATFTPAFNLTPNTTYVGKITTAVKDVNGNALQQDYIWTFTTGTTLQPRVTATSPASDETNVALNKVSSASFNMPMNPLTINTTSFTLKQGTTAISGVVTYTGNKAFFTPNGNLTANTIYTATITTGAKNTAGTPINADYVWNFTTGTAIAPKVISTSPTPNENGVLLNKVITATFDMTMNPLTIPTSFTLKQGTNTVSGNVTYLGNTASFTPTNPLLENTTYTTTISTTAKNVAGIALANEYVWSFTTLNNSIAPNLGTAAMFGAFGGNAGVTNQGLNTVINNGSISTTAASTLVTGFHDATAIYTETPLNKGFVTGAIYTAPPAPGTATSFAIATQGLADANAAYLSISPASMPGGTDPGAGELGGLTLAPGIYKSASGSFNISNG